MPIPSDFDPAHAIEDNPGGGGAADGKRYDLYRERLLAHVRSRVAILDIGSGHGAFLARLAGDFERAFAVEIAARSVAEAAGRYPWITFWEGSAAALGDTEADALRYSAIVYRDGTSFLDADGTRHSLDWIADHLEPDGVALVVACAAGDYDRPPEGLSTLAAERFVVLEQQVLGPQNLLVLRARERLVALTLNHGPELRIPEERHIDWDNDVFGPTDALFDGAAECGATFTLFADIGAYLWLEEREPKAAERMAEQWRRATEEGHDVQLQVSSGWLPEMEVSRNGGGWPRDPELSAISLYEGDLHELIARCRATLENAIRPMYPGYEVTCFRAGAFEAQPFRRLHDALVANGIACDSSVYHGGRHEGGTYDFRLAFSTHQPYFASVYDPQLRAPPSERDLVELPIFAPRPNERWTFDFDWSRRFADTLLETFARPKSSPKAERWRARFIAAGGLAYLMLRRWRRGVNRVLPRALAYALVPYSRERAVEDDYFVLAGHSGGNLDVDAIGQGLCRIAPHVRFAKLSELADRARTDLERGLSDDRAVEADLQVDRARPGVLGTARNERQSAELQRRIPLDRQRILDLGCGSGDWSARIAAQRPWSTVHGVDVGEEFVAHANLHHGSDRVDFGVADFASLPLEDGSFDCIYADNSLEHAFDVDRTLAEVYRVLCDSGVLVAAVPSDARNPERAWENHTWKTAPHDVEQRLIRAGFRDVSISELDAYRQLGVSPYPPSRDQMMFVTAWRRPISLTPFERARQGIAFRQ